MTAMENIKTRLAVLLMAAAITMTACETETPSTDANGTLPDAPTQTPSYAELLVGRWQQTKLDEQTLPSFLIAIDEYRADGMFISSVENATTEVYFADSSGYAVMGDTIIYDAAGWGSTEIEHLDSLRLKTKVHLAEYNTTSTYEYERL